MNSLRHERAVRAVMTRITHARDAAHSPNNSNQVSISQDS